MATAQEALAQFYGETPATVAKAPIERVEVPHIREESPLNEFERAMWTTMRTPEAKYEFLSGRFKEQNILKPDDPSNLHKDWAIKTDNNNIYPIELPLEVGGREITKKIAGAIPEIAVGTLGTMGQAAGAIGGALAAPFTAGIINPLTGEMAGGALATGAAETGVEMLGRKLAGVQAPVSKADIAAATAAGVIPFGAIGEGFAAKKAGKGFVRGIKEYAGGRTTFADLVKGVSKKDITEGYIAQPKITRDIAQKSTENLTDKESKFLSILPLKEIENVKFAKTPTTVTNIIENMGERAGIDDSIVSHGLKRSAEGKVLSVTDTAWKEAPDKISLQIIPDINNNTIKPLEQWAGKEYARVYDAIPDTIKNKVIGGKDINTLVKDLATYNPEIDKIAEKIGLNKAKYSFKDLYNVKTQLANEMKLARSYARDITGGVSSFMPDPLTESLRNLDSTVRQTINNKVPQMSKVNKIYGEIKDATNLISYRLHPNRAERFVKSLADPDWKQLRVVEPFKRLESAVIKYGKKAKAEPFYDKLFDQLYTYKMGDLKHKVELPIVRGIAGKIPVIGKAIKEYTSLEKPTFSRMIGLGARALGTAEHPTLLGTVTRPIGTLGAETLGLGRKVIETGLKPKALEIAGVKRGFQQLIPQKPTQEKKPIYKIPSRLDLSLLQNNAVSKTMRKNPDGTLSQAYMNALKKERGLV